MTKRGNEREKMSVLSMVGFDGGVLGAYPIYGSFNRLQFNYGMRQYFIPLIPHDSF